MNPRLLPPRVRCQPISLHLRSLMVNLRILSLFHSTSYLLSLSPSHTHTHIFFPSSPLFYHSYFISSPFPLIHPPSLFLRASYSSNALMEFDRYGLGKDLHEKPDAQGEFPTSAPNHTDYNNPFYDSSAYNLNNAPSYNSTSNYSAAPYNAPHFNYTTSHGQFTSADSYNRNLPAIPGRSDFSSAPFSYGQPNVNYNSNKPLPAVPLAKSNTTTSTSATYPDPYASTVNDNVNNID